MVNDEEEMVVTPWEVSGKVDYERLIKEFGTQPLTEGLIKRIEKVAGYRHLQLRRKIFFSHRDLDVLLNLYDKGERFVLYTGRGPSSHNTLGHMMPWIFTKYLQDAFKVKLYFQMTDDEKFLVKRDLTIGDARGYAYDNALDVIAVGFQQDKTKIILDTKNIGILYELALRVAKLTTYSTAKAVFGFKDESNIGIIFYTAIQSAPCFLESVLTGKKVPCLIPAAIDQDPHWRITRDAAPRLGYYKPAQIHCKFLPSLQQSGKMSASVPETAIYLTDTAKEVTKKIMNAFTGGRPTVAEQRKLGGNPDVCPVHQYFYYLFEEDDRKMAELNEKCRRGEILCGECKQLLVERVTKFLIEHQAKREKAKNVLDNYLLK
ncbi:MAG: tryptophan--tRNA ligase [Promethearchaeati archaeon SRVP18_Atabeyarchaeia-1]